MFTGERPPKGRSSALIGDIAYGSAHQSCWRTAYILSSLSAGYSPEQDPAARNYVALIAGFRSTLKLRGTLPTMYAAVHSCSADLWWTRKTVRGGWAIGH